MGKRRLKMQRPAMRLAAPRAKRLSGPDRDAVRAKVLAWRRWYKSPEWRALRLKVARRDGWTCQRTGALLVGKHPAPNSLAVHHIRPHNGDRRLFFDESNCQAVSKAWHDEHGQREDRDE